MERFEIGTTYRATFIGDSELHLDFKVIARTEKTVTFFDSVDKVNIRRKVRPNYDGRCEVASYASYSMAPLFGADKKTPNA